VASKITWLNAIPRNCRSSFNSHGMSWSTGEFEETVARAGGPGRVVLSDRVASKITWLNAIPRNCRSSFNSHGMSWSTGEFEETVARAGGPGRVLLSPLVGAVAPEIAGVTRTNHAASHGIRKFKIRVHMNKSK